MFLMYVDESGDCGLQNSPTRYLVLTGLVIHELRWQVPGSDDRVPPPDSRSVSSEAARGDSCRKDDHQVRRFAPYSAK